MLISTNSKLWNRHGSDVDELAAREHGDVDGWRLSAKHRTLLLADQVAELELAETLEYLLKTFLMFSAEVFGRIDLGKTNRLILTGYALSHRISIVPLTLMDRLAKSVGSPHLADKARSLMLVLPM